MNARDALGQLNTARRLADTGQHAAVVEFLGRQARSHLPRSPTLALLYGTAHARLGRHAEGVEWVDKAIKHARERGDRIVEVRALNVRGAIALEAGRIGLAADYFMRALAEAEQENDHRTVGLCSINLGIIANMRGQYDAAVSRYTLALAAFQKASLLRGVAMTHHNLGITYRDQEDFDHALEMAGHAVDEATRAGDRALAGQALAGRAEIRALSGAAKIARREIERAIATHAELSDAVREVEDLRILATCQAAMGEVADAEITLRDVLDRAADHRRPLLAATVRRDLACLLDRMGRTDESREEAHTARTVFDDLGCLAEVRKLDKLLRPSLG